MKLNRKIIPLAVAAVCLSSIATGVMGADVPDYGEEWTGSEHKTPPAYGEEWKGSDTTTETASIPVITPSFSDVPSTHWAFYYIEDCRNLNLFDGYLDGTFRPESNITRSEAMKVCVSEMALPLETPSTPSFSDVGKESWYYSYVETGKDLLPYRDDIQGAGIFKPDTAITREDAVYMLVKSLGYERYVYTVEYSILNKFSDRSDISPDLEAYMAVAIKHNLIDGYDDGTVMPKSNLTRAEFAALLSRAGIRK